jgi:endonuclease YncB( thermonuclease family)
VGHRVLREGLSARAGYGTAVLAEIANDVGVDQRTLQHAVQLARLYAQEPSGTLNWSQYRELIRLKDDNERAYYEALAQELGWSKRELVAAIQDDAFGLSLTDDKRPNKANAGKSLPRPTAPDYLYTVEPLRVIDGDTIDVQVDLGFEVLRRYRLRLAAVNTPEKKTPRAAEAARYVVERLAASTMVVVQTVRVDLHGRYVAHVFYSTQQSDSQSKAEVYASGHYLNQELVQQGLAKVVTPGK